MVEGGIVVGQVTASLDGLERRHLAALRALIVKENAGRDYAGALNEVRRAIDDALKEWNDHDLAETQPACRNPATHKAHNRFPGNGDVPPWCTGVNEQGSGPDWKGPS